MKYMNEFYLFKFKTFTLNRSFKLLFLSNKHEFIVLIYAYLDLRLFVKLP